MAGQRSLMADALLLVTQLEQCLAEKQSAAEAQKACDDREADLADRLMEHLEDHDRESLRIGSRLVRIVLSPPVVDWRAELVEICGEEVAQRIEAATLRRPYVRIKCLDDDTLPA
jgi:hypothetical protein